MCSFVLRARHSTQDTHYDDTRHAVHLLHFLGLAEPLQAVQSLTSGSFLQSFLQNLLPHFGNSGDGESGGGDGGDGEGGGGLGGGIGEAGEGHAHSSQLGSTALT